MQDEFSMLLKYARKEAGLTQKELAEILGVATGTVQQWEIGVRFPRVEMLKKIEDTLKIALVPCGVEYEFKDVPPYKVSEGQIQAIKSWSNDRTKKRLLDAYDKLNEIGQGIAVAQIETLAEQKELQRKELKETSRETGSEGGDHNAPKREQPPEGEITPTDGKEET